MSCPAPGRSSSSASWERSRSPSRSACTWVWRAPPPCRNGSRWPSTRSNASAPWTGPCCCWSHRPAPGTSTTRPSRPSSTSPSATWPPSPCSTRCAPRSSPWTASTRAASRTVPCGPRSTSGSRPCPRRIARGWSCSARASARTPARTPCCTRAPRDCVTSASSVRCGSGRRPAAAGAPRSAAPRQPGRPGSWSGSSTASRTTSPSPRTGAPRCGT